MPTSKIKTTLAYKVYLIILISIAFSALFIGTFSYYQSKKMLSENIGSGLQKIAQTAVLGIDGSELSRIESAESPYYKVVKSYLVNVKDQNGLTSPICILKIIDKKHVSLFVTTDEGAPFGARYELNPTLKRVLEAGKSDFSPIYTDKSGTWISAYAPIRESSGFISGILGLDYHVGYYIRELRYRLLKIIMLCLVGFIAGALTSVPLLRPILRSINILTVAASEMEKGNYDYKVELESSDEIGYLARAFDKMRHAIKEYIEKLKESWLAEKKSHLESIKALSEAIAVRETYTKGHIERVSKYAELIAREMGLAEDEIEIIKHGCIIHDIGKIGINIDIINKPSKLTAEERKNIEEHPRMGAQIIEGIEFLERARDIILYHHERYDGTGYPEGLKGEKIPLSARIVSLVDAYDAMASTRPYRKKFTSEEIIAIIKEESGRQFDPKVVGAFLRIENKLIS